MQIIVYTTTATKKEAQTLARLLVQKKVVACAQIDGPIQSVYRWKGEISTATEYRLVLKTERAKYSRVERIILAHHSYEVPEVIAVPVTAGSKKYLQWLKAQLR